jgi:hypothetical protein
MNANVLMTSQVMSFITRNEAVFEKDFLQNGSTGQTIPYRY